MLHLCNSSLCEAEQSLGKPCINREGSVGQGMSLLMTSKGKQDLPGGIYGFWWSSGRKSFPQSAVAETHSGNIEPLLKGSKKFHSQFGGQIGLVALVSCVRLSHLLTSHSLPKSSSLWSSSWLVWCFPPSQEWRWVPHTPKGKQMFCFSFPHGKTQSEGGADGRSCLKGE